MQIQMVGSQEVCRRLIEANTPVDVKLLVDVSGCKVDAFHCGVLQLTQEEVLFDIGRHVVFFPLPTDQDRVSFRPWQELHLQACTEFLWHGAYIYTVTERVPGVNLLTVYKLCPIEVGQPTYVVFSNLIPPTKLEYAQIKVYSDPVPAFDYDYLAGRDWIDWV